MRFQLKDGDTGGRCGCRQAGWRHRAPWQPGLVWTCLGATFRSPGCGMGRLGPTSLWDGQAGPTSTQSIFFKHAWALIHDRSSSAVDPGLLVSSLSVNILLDSLHINEWRKWSPLSSWADILGRLCFLWEAVFPNVIENHSQCSKLGECGNLSLMVGGWLVVRLAPLLSKCLHIGVFNKFLWRRYFVKRLLLLELAWYFKALVLFVYLCLNVCM